MDGLFLAVIRPEGRAGFAVSPWGVMASHAAFYLIASAFFSLTYLGDRLRTALDVAYGDEEWTDRVDSGSHSRTL